MQAVVEGTNDPALDDVVALLADNLDSGEELGAALVVTVDDQPVMDVWGGSRDGARLDPWTRDTIVNVWSCTKLVTNLAALMLVERGLLDVHAPVATYWPEFAANGKSEIEVRHIMSHTSGVSGWAAPWDVDDMYDWTRATEQLASQPPWWTPGSASGYHATNQGHLIGELVRRITGQTLKEFVRDEIAGPLDADFQIGAAEADVDRIAEIIPPPPSDVDLSALDPNSPMVKTFTGPVLGASSANTAPWRRADLGALNGHGNARSLARILSTISQGGASNGVSLLSSRTIDLIFEEQSDDVDLVLGIPLRWGIGFGLPQRDTVPYLPDGKVCYWGGWGGSMVVMHPERGLTISYAMNKMAPGIIGSDRSAAYIEAIYRALD